MQKMHRPVIFVSLTEVMMLRYTLLLLFGIALCLVGVYLAPDHFLTAVLCCAIAAPCVAVGYVGITFS